jgi:hypothetical protein
MYIELLEDVVKGFRVRVVDADGLTLRTFTYPTIESARRAREGVDSQGPWPAAGVGFDPTSSWPCRDTTGPAQLNEVRLRLSAKSRTGRRP